MKQKPKPTPEKFGYHQQSGFDDEPSGWMIEGGEEAYRAALAEWAGEAYSCLSCGEEWDDDFWCKTRKGVCLNCCPCAFGISVRKGGICEPLPNQIVLRLRNDDSDELPF
jgi:hypothetical protein